MWLVVTVLDNPGANLINILASFVKPVFVLIFSAAYFDSYKKSKCLNFFLQLKKEPQAVGH